MPSNSDLWQRIQGFEIDNPSDELPFSSRLARENGWSREKALEAIDEYRKFIYLICVSASPLTPSEVVDQVWHLHLVYTRSYWKDFCEGVLGRPIHHEPTRGGELQALRFREQYAQTRALYEAEFGGLPPAEFWPSVSERFAAAPSLQWTDLRRYWAIPKPSGFGSILWSTAGVLLVFLTSCADAWSEERSDMGSSASLWPFLVVGALAVAGLVSYKLDKSRRDNAGEHSESNGWWWHSGCGGCGSGCGGCGGCGG